MGDWKFYPPTFNHLITIHFILIAFFTKKREKFQGSFQGICENPPPTQRKSNQYQELPIDPSSIFVSKTDKIEFSVWFVGKIEKK